MAEIIVRRNGPFRVTGPIVLKDHDGNVIDTKDVFTLCRCGHSRIKPFCDASHKAAGFVDPAPAAEPA